MVIVIDSMSSQPPATSPVLRKVSNEVTNRLHAWQVGALSLGMRYGSVVATLQLSTRMKYTANWTAPSTVCCLARSGSTGGFSPGRTPAPVVSGPVRLGEGDVRGRTGADVGTLGDGLAAGTPLFPHPAAGITITATKQSNLLRIAPSRVMTAAPAPRRLLRVALRLPGRTLRQRQSAASGCTEAAACGHRRITLL